MKTVLAPIDFSDISRRVIDEAIVIARVIGARLVLLHVVQLPSLLGSGVAEDDLPVGFHLQAERDAITRLAKLQKQLRDEGVTAHVIHQVGLPGEKILEQAERLEADYLVMGSHGHGALYELIVGSTTMGILKQAACPVAIVPPATKTLARARPSFAEPRPASVV
jgi:nucleotide-binding universal stress UspA family protein